MFEYVTADDVAAEIKMLRSSFPGTILLVEGNTDSNFFKKFTDANKCYIIPAYEKNNALNTVSLLEQEDFDGILAIVDADFWHIDGFPQDYNNVLPTDYHDLEIMIIATKSLETILREYGSPTKIKKLLKISKNSNVRDLILKTCLPVGLLRWLSIKYKYNLKFEGLDFNKFVDKNCLSIDLDKLVRNVVSLTSRKGLRTADISSKLRKSLNSDQHDYLQICCGHDFISVLSVGLRKALGSKSSQLTLPKNLGKFLRISYDAQDFKKTHLHNLSKDWEARNNPFKVFSI